MLVMIDAVYQGIGGSMAARKVIEQILFVVAIPVVILGLIDPLEGGLAMVVATVIYAVAFVLARSGPPRYLWIPFAAALVSGGTAILTVVVTGRPQETSEIPVLAMIGLVVYELSVVAAIAGAVLTAVHSFESPKVRRVVSLIGFVAVIPFEFLGLIDPLEGGLALIAATVIYVIAFALARRAPAKYLWIPFAIAFIAGAFAILSSILGRNFEPGPSTIPLATIIGMWTYRAAVVALLIGGVITAVKRFQDRSLPHEG